MVHVSYGTLKIVDFEKIWHIKVTVIPGLNAVVEIVLLYFIWKFAFLLEKNMIHKQQCAPEYIGAWLMSGLQEKRN